MKIRVPDVPHPTLCYAQKLNPPAALGRCDRPRDHLGPHSWALADCLRDLDGLEQTLRRQGADWWDSHPAPDLDRRSPGAIAEHLADRIAALLAPYRALLEPTPAREGAEKVR